MSQDTKPVIKLEEYGHDIGADLYSGADEELVDPDEAGIDEGLLDGLNDGNDDATGSPPTGEASGSHQAATVTGPSGSAPIPSFGSSSGNAFAARGDGSSRMAYQMDGTSRQKPADGYDEGKMFIGGLNWETDDETLRSYFLQFGKISSSSIMRDPAGRSRGFAFLTFEDPASVNAVVVKEHVLDGKRIDPKRAVPREEHIKSQKVFVGGLAPTVTNAMLKDLFTNLGATVLDAHIMLDRESGRNKGFAFVTFAADSDLLIALEATGSVIEGRSIEVKRAQPRNPRDGNPMDVRSIDSSFATAGAQGSKYVNPTGYHNNNFNNNRGFMGAGQAAPYPNMASSMPYGMPGFGGVGGMNQMSGGMGGTAFDPQAMAMMYQRMLSMMNPMLTMNMQAGLGGFAGGAGNPGAINPAMMGMQPGFAGQAIRPGPTANPGNTPKGPKAMQNPAAAPPGGPARNSTHQGQSRTRPY